MSAATVLDAPPVPAEVDDEVSHVYCLRCRTAVAWCGHRYDGPLAFPVDRRLGPRCVVCIDLYWSPCPHCGAP